MAAERGRSAGRNGAHDAPAVSGGGITGVRELEAHPLALGTRAMGDENTREFIRKFDARW
jgi:hypothetical protein